MARVDPNLRQLLDTLSVREGIRHPTANLEALRSIVERLNPEDRARSLKLTDAPRRTSTDATVASTPDPGLNEELRRAQEERDELARRVAELEAGTAGDVSFAGLDDEPAPEPEAPAGPVRFERLDAPRSSGYDAPPTAQPLDAEPPMAHTWTDEDPLVAADPEDPFGTEADEDLLEFEAMTREPAPTWEEPGAEDAAWDDEAATTPSWADESTDAIDDDVAAEPAWGSEFEPGEVAEPAPAEEATDDLAELERQLRELEDELEGMHKRKGSA